MKLLACLIAAGVWSASPVPADSKMGQAAKEFLASLDTKQRSQCLLPADSPDRNGWMYVPGDRKGLSWGEMSEKQQRLAHALLKASLSGLGYDKIMQIRSLEPVLAQMENGNASRDPLRYWFVFYGQPDSERPWLWRYEGHHVSLTFANRGTRLVASTPQFLGSNPAEVKSGPLKGQRVLSQEQDLGFKLAESLTVDQMKEAVVAKVAPVDIVTGSQRQVGIQDKSGLHFHDMDKAQKQTLRDLIQVHASVQTKDEQARRLKKIADEGYDDIVFSWMGPVSRAGRHYYRIQGPSFLIEYDNTQEDGNHIHTVWRDFKGDFGEDALAEHYAHSDHQHGHDD